MTTLFNIIGHPLQMRRVCYLLVTLTIQSALRVRTQLSLSGGVAIPIVVDRGLHFLALSDAIYSELMYLTSRVVLLGGLQAFVKSISRWPARNHNHPHLLSSRPRIRKCNSQRACVDSASSNPRKRNTACAVLQNGGALH